MSNDQKRIDNYKPLKFFQDNAPKTNTGFSKFTKGKSHYFAYFFGSKIVLISEAYKAESGRDNGIESVKKNMKLEERYRFSKHKNGKHYFDLIAGNHQEIATSVWFGSEKASKNMADILMGKTPTTDDREVDNYHPLAFYTARISGVKDGFDKFKANDGHYFTYNQDGKIVLISEAYTSEKGRDNGIESVKKNMKLENRYDYRKLKNGRHDYRIKAGNNQEIARSAWYGSAAAATAGAALLIGKKMAGDRDVDNYHPLAFYESRIKGVKNGFDRFSADDGHYFTYNEDGKIVLISEAYTNVAGRNNGVESVRKNMKIEDRYKFRKLKNGKHDYIIKAGNNQQIARSIWYGSATAAAAGAAFLMGRKKLAAASAYVEPPAAVPPVVAAPAAAAAYVEPVAASGAWGWLKWLALALLALLALFFLSKCFVAKPPVPLPPVLITCWDGSKAENEAACPASYTCWDESLVKNASACPPEPPTTFTCWDGSTVEDINSCPAQPPAEEYVCWDGSIAANATACPKQPDYECWDGSMAINARACPVKPEPIDPIGGDLTCSCAYSAEPIFNNTKTSTPVSIGRLGTLPEFGYVGDLTPEEFYYKLLDRYATNEFDKSYLDYLFVSMGYELGFAGVSVDAFSNNVLAQGAKGILGFDDKHNFAYSQLNVRDSKDLQSFMIKSKNGCDVNFMKTCGNYMYVCE